VDEPAAAVVRRIFASYLGGMGLKAIAEALTRDGVPSPSASDRARNPHRCGIAWSCSAVAAILANPRYTGRQVWNRQRKDEVQHCRRRRARADADQPGHHGERKRRRVRERGRL
jgi:site-specific DNA recombinase